MSGEPTPRWRRRAARGIAAFGMGSLALSLGLTPALAHPGELSDELRVSGTVMLVPSETVGTDGELGSESSSVWLATDDGPILPLDETTLSQVAPNGEPVSGARLEGAVEVPVTVARAVEQQIAEHPVVLSDEKALALVAEAATDAEQQLPVLSAETTQPAATAPAGVQHQADVALLVGPGQTGLPSNSEITALLARVSSYWTDQTGGLIAGITAGSIKRIPVSTMQGLCSFNTNWTNASAAFGQASSSYGAAGSTRHLVMLALNPKCATPGQGTVGSTKLNGGVSWTNLEDYTPARGAVVAAQTLAHELGHNFGLGHANARICSTSASDAGEDGNGRAAAPCSDVEYGDLWNVMGVGIAGYTKQPAALAIDQREVLGATDASMLAAVDASDGSSQTITIKALTATSGLRGIRVQGERGTPFYVEYRNGAGQDAGMPQAGGTAALVRVSQTVTVAGKATTVRQPLSAATGVRIVKLHDTSSGAGSVVLSRKVSSQYRQTFSTGNSVRLAGGTAQLTVISIASGAATVRIDFADPFLPVSQTVSGAATVGATLATSSGSWSPKPERLQYQWLRDGAAIPGATAAKYRLAGTDADKRISVRVIGTRNGRSESATSRSTGRVLRAMTAVRPKVSGKFRVGARLAAHHGAWRPGGVRFTYRWLRNGKAISGATSSRYRLKSADLGKLISVKVTGKKAGYAERSTTSSKRRIRSA